MAFMPPSYRIPDPLPRASSDVQNNATIAEMQAQLARQYLMIQTLCHILLAKGVVEEKELTEWMSYVDKFDGTEDGKLRESKAPHTCPKCQRVNSPRAVKCQYCGEELPVVFLEKDRTKGK